MEQYLVKKVLNNNVILVQKNYQNYILVGKGIGFGKAKGTLLKNLSNIEERFISLKGLDEDEYESFITTVDPKVIETTQKIIEMLKKEIKEKLDSHAYVALIDHINFAIKRLKEGISIVNPFLFEIKLMYPDEYDLAEKSVTILEEDLQIDIPEAEVGFLTLHIYGVRKDKNKNEALENSKMISEILKLVENKLKVKLEKNSFIYRRFVMHLIGIIDRVKNKKYDGNEFMQKLQNDLQSEFNIAYYIVRIMEKTLKTKIPDAEMGYIALHLYKIRQ
ncbi:PRD domain-containing protein [Paramaledivibacter caminithermalis]|jgi:transcriptional antiterminator|uniref:Transcriptional antiterminator, BglG family n=1 Tax=Paramaledivibacter caminithermalis (strain DSM 15212 / CIP 107654 / DViRD3) TaxID=1121301 RepID=A0A1M6KUI6_PARC5|nr:PRD domain-containing protein [Paramaledivibacter caminithermalis]SHJ62603.1 transcriptional antiterminator, BglG family [Paramaledivibacter caminithermalis DSM 15212]